jgi:DNA polymerase III subunit delta'
VREMITEISYQPFEARYRVVILDPAELMRIEAHNSLLKTLEEPPSRSIIVLVTTNPYLLLQTIRSRSRMLQFGGIPEDLIADYLVRARGRAPEEARVAAGFSQGSLTAALTFDTERYREVRSLALRFVSLLLNRGRFAEASVLVASLGKDKDAFAMWLESVEALLQDVYFLLVAPERVGQSDMPLELVNISNAASRTAIVSAILAMRRFRQSLKSNVHRQIALESLFLAETSRKT